MKRSYPQPDREQGETIATWGHASLIKKPDRKYELVGGSEADTAEADKWISLFMKNANVLRVPPAPQRPGGTAD